MNIITLNWFGPFNDKDEIKHYSKFLRNGIYAFFGIGKYIKNNDIILQYIGKTENTFYDRIKVHKRWDEDITRVKISWFGVIVNKREYDLEEIEHKFIYFCEPRLNEKKVFTKPKESTIIISEFFNKKEIFKDEKTPYVNVPIYLRSIPELIFWNSKYNILKKSQKLESIDYSKD